ncbi:methyltransferase domain-containing protein [Streptomyces antimicrobicus]|uniref:Class I SAM-dependent methyltransferase n=1 Tax=Streptomyces antimicrobicus TaxID=2883108 RepID=A0ABS8BEX4_9ACTN|nr:class I SAM-dependent methyltransferase [Streptomyces antimicrobicus]MCB5183176.1 class I SAM-dependent methyltransferase [Streptomyces antimicrobicus]
MTVVRPAGPGAGLGPGAGGGVGAGGGGGVRSGGAWLEDPYARALRAGRGPLFLRRPDGWVLPLEVERWLADADPADESVLSRCRGAVLDIGCGPGRLVAALAGRGHPVLGVDVSPAAVTRTVRRGGSALCRSVFGPLPGEGRWTTALLLDGNIGIGGDPGALLGRVAGLLGPVGRLIAEAAEAEVDECHEVRLDDGRGPRGVPFRWSRLGPTALLRHAERAGWTPLDTWTASGRHFAELAPGPAA